MDHPEQAHDSHSHSHGHHRHPSLLTHAFLTMPDHPVFDDIMDGNLTAVKRRVLKHPTLCAERNCVDQTPLIAAVYNKEPAIALWLIEHGQSELDAAVGVGLTALHYACREGMLGVAHTLVVAGANPLPLDKHNRTPLIFAASAGRAEVVSFLLSLPAVRAAAAMNTVDGCGMLPLSLACSNNELPTIKVLLNAGADPTIPAGAKSPLNQAARHLGIPNLIFSAIESQRPRLLHKARALLDAAHAVRKAKVDARDKGLSASEQLTAAISAAPAYLKGQAGGGVALPRVELTPPPTQGVQAGGDAVERLRAVMAFVLGMGEETGLPPKRFAERLGCLVPRADPAWRGAPLGVIVDE